MNASRRLFQKKYRISEKMTNHCTVHEMMKMLTGTVSRRQLYRMLEDPRVRAMIKYTGGRRYLPVNRFLEYVAGRVTALKQAEQSNGCKEAVLEYLHAHGRTTSGVIAKAVGHSMHETKKALAEL